MHCIKNRKGIIIYDEAVLYILLNVKVKNIQKNRITRKTINVRLRVYNVCIWGVCKENKMNTYGRENTSSYCGGSGVPLGFKFGI